MGSAAGSCVVVVALWLVAAGVPVVRATADQVLITEDYTRISATTTTQREGPHIKIYQRGCL